MPKTKTRLSAECQWERTAAYFAYLNPLQAVDDIVSNLGIWRGTHSLVSDGDVLILTSINGSGERYGMTGISSKGIRLANCFLPIRRGFEQVQLPDDFTGKQWNDLVIGRYVADLRASRRSRVSAYSPAPSHCKILSGLDTCQITSFGLYKSGRTLLSTRKCDYRHYLRFYPDGSVTFDCDFNHQGWRISWYPGRISPANQQFHGASPKGVVQITDNGVAFDLFAFGDAFFARFIGSFENGCLWLSCDSPDSRIAHEKLPYRFHPFNPAAYDDLEQF